MAQGTLEMRPYNSPLLKLAIRPKKSRRLIKPEPQSDGGEFCEGDVSGCVAVISRSDVPELLELVDAALNKIALFVFVLAEKDVFDPHHVCHPPECRTGVGA